MAANRRAGGAARRVGAAHPGRPRARSRSLLAAECRRRKESLHAFGLHLEELRRRSTATDAELREATRRLGDLKSRRAEAGALLAEGERAASLRAGQLLRLEAEEGEVRDRIRRRETERARIARRAGRVPGPPRAIGLHGRRARRGARRRDRRGRREPPGARGRAARTGTGSAPPPEDIGWLRAQHEEQRERLAAGRGRPRRRPAGPRCPPGARAGGRFRGRGETPEAGRRNGPGSRLRSGRPSGFAAPPPPKTVAAHDAERGARRDLDALEARLGSVKALVLSREQPRTRRNPPAGGGAPAAAGAPRRRG